MGFYDCLCSLTGVSLKGSKTALVLLRANGEGFVPLTLAIHGQYNRLGSIDMLDEDAHTAWLMKAIRAEAKAGRLTFDEDLDDPLENLEAFLQGCERNLNEAGPEGCLCWQGQPVLFALVANVVWTALVGAAKPNAATPAALAETFFGSSPLGVPAKQADQEPFASKLHELRAVTEFMATLPTTWQPTPADGQHYTDDLQQFLEEARARFAGIPPLPEALDAYAAEVDYLLEDEDDEE